MLMSSIGSDITPIKRIIMKSAFNSLLHHCCQIFLQTVSKLLPVSYFPYMCTQFLHAPVSGPVLCPDNDLNQGPCSVTQDEINQIFALMLFQSFQSEFVSRSTRGNFPFPQTLTYKRASLFMDHLTYSALIFLPTVCLQSSWNWVRFTMRGTAMYKAPGKLQVSWQLWGPNSPYAIKEEVDNPWGKRQRPAGEGKRQGQYNERRDSRSAHDDVLQKTLWW